MYISKRGNGIAPSMTLAIDAKAKQMAASGIDVIGFGAGEPDFPTPAYIIAAAKEALDKGVTRYTPADGTLDLKKAICEKLLADNGLTYTPQQIVVSNGAKHSLYNVFQAILNPGDEVIIASPYWVSYPEMVRMADGVPVFVETTEQSGFLLTQQALAGAITQKTRAIILNNPGNPCGNLYSVQDLQWIADLAVKHGIYVISDEIYEELVYDGSRPASIASLGKEIYDLTIVVNGVSKAYAMTGWRIGYTASHPDIAKVMANIQSHATSNPNAMAQYASAAALRGGKTEIIKMRDEFKKRRDYMVARINAIPGVSTRTPGGAFYCMMNVSGLFGKNYKGTNITDSLTLCAALLEEKHVAMVPGVAFGANDFVRLSYATSTKNIEQGLDRFAEFVSQLK